MSLFHRHRWVEVGRVFVPPARRAEFEGVSPAFAGRVLFGFTSVELRCSDCGDVESREMDGDHSIPNGDDVDV